MRKFLVTVILFFSGITAFFVLTLSLLSFFISNKIEGLKDLNISTLVVGDSHIEVGINDGLMPNAVNYANSGEPLFFTFYKLDAILSQNSSIEAVYLGMAYHNISAGYDQSIFGNGKKSVASRYFFILPVDEQVRIMKNNFPKIHNLGKEVIINGIKTLIYNNQKNPLLGGHNNDFVNVKADSLLIAERVKYHFFDNSSLYGFSEININYLEKIKLLCQETNTDLMLINTPLHPFYREHVPIGFKKRYASIIRDLDLKLINLEDLPLRESFYTPDGDHVSKEGAIITTLELNNYSKQ